MEHFNYKGEHYLAHLAVAGITWGIITVFIEQDNKQV